MNKCDLCDKPTPISSYFCEDCGKICRRSKSKSQPDLDCGKPAAWGGCGFCQEHWQEDCKEIDSVMQFADDAFWAGEFDKVNERLKELDVATLSSQMCVTWLTVSKWAESKLPYRPEFFKKCYDRLVEVRGVETANKLTKYRGVDEEIQKMLKGIE